MNNLRKYAEALVFDSSLIPTLPRQMTRNDKGLGSVLSREHLDTIVPRNEGAMGRESNTPIPPGSVAY